ncbi:hypothetical protein PHLCEN_2v9976 [Hermanssonia centrifuga]|uniref:Uncharacterized protein n=1 Tax=Hermanssonia centrifuga TaxID=98765 RepID=A0A2R6NP86_9APHY|nr:hypothetical protein PHLCEN_2v9976 [Hermanssonia centrifuga]
MNELVRHAGDKIDWDARGNQGKTALDYAPESRLPMNLLRLLKRYSRRDILEQGRGMETMGMNIYIVAVAGGGHGSCANARFAWWKGLGFGRWTQRKRRMRMSFQYLGPLNHEGDLVKRLTRYW